MLHSRSISTFMMSRTFRRKLKALLTAQVTSHLDTDGADSSEFAELVAQFKPEDEKSWRAFERASALSFRRFTESAMSLIEIETGDTSAIDHHEPSKRRIAEFMAGRIARHELYYMGSTWRLRQLAAGVNAHNDLTHAPVGTKMPGVVETAQSASA